VAKAEVEEQVEVKEEVLIVVMNFLTTTQVELNWVAQRRVKYIRRKHQTKSKNPTC
jgi:hypothetical protein